MEPKPTESLFRKEALEKLQRDEEIQEPLRVSPSWTWSLLWLMATIIGVAMLGSFFGKVEVNRSYRGILRPAAGVRVIQAQVGGALAETRARSGDFLKEGQVIARIDSASVQGSVLEMERQLDFLRSKGKGFNSKEEDLTQEQSRIVKSKIASQQSQMASYQRSVQLQQKKIEATRKLLAEGLVASFALDDSIDQLNSIERQRDSAKQQLEQLQQELVALESQRQRQIWQHTQEFSGAEFKREALDSSLRQTVVTAPVNGYLEAFVARPGDLIQAGQTVAKLLPAGSSLQVVAFIDEKDRAFLKPGDRVLLELDSYPYSEFGTLKGSVLRIGSDLSSPHEAREAFGEDAKLEAPAFRVEIELLAERPPRLRDATLRPGMLLQARFTLRRQRLITLVLDLLRHWVE